MPETFKISIVFCEIFKRKQATDDDFGWSHKSDEAVQLTRENFIKIDLLLPHTAHFTTWLIILFEPLFYYTQ